MLFMRYEKLFFLKRKRKNRPPASSERMVWEVKVHTEKLFLFIFYPVLFVVIVIFTVQNIQSPWGILLSTGIFMLSFTFRNASQFLASRTLKVKYLVFVEILLVSLTFFLDSGSITAICYYIIIANVTLLYENLFSGISAGTCLILYVSVNYLKDGLPEAGVFLTSVSGKLLYPAILYVLMLLIKLEMIQEQQLREALFRLKMKTKQSEDVYIKLKETTTELEEMTAVKERNRIAREIHDTVGHTLTTVLIELEAGQRLIPVSPEEASEKLALAKVQVRKGLNDIRESVRMLKKGRDIKDLTHSLILLIEETMKHGDVFIRYEISPLPPLTPDMENILYRALSEGLTNGMKHGKSTAFVFRLKVEPDKICFFLQDNGTGINDIVFGYGLTAMKEGVDDIGGVLSVNSSYGKGFTTKIEFPMNKGDQL